MRTFDLKGYRHSVVIPAKAGIQGWGIVRVCSRIISQTITLRGNRVGINPHAKGTQRRLKPPRWREFFLAWRIHSHARRLRPILCGLVFSLCQATVPSHGSAQDLPSVSVEASVDRTEITIGDRILYNLTIQGAKGVEFQKPGWGEGLQGFQILDFEQGQKETIGDRWKVVDTYILSTFTPEDYVIPPIWVPVTLPSGATRVLQTQPINIAVASVLPEDEEEILEIRDIKNPVPVYSGILTERILAIAGGVALLVLLAYWLWRRSRRREDFVPAAPPRPEHEVALEKLADLENLVAGWGLSPDRIQCKQFGLDLSEILREYLENRYGFIALEMTTYEIERILPAILKTALHRTPVTDQENPLALATRVLEKTDLLKFAKFTFPSETLVDLLGDCRGLVEATWKPRRTTESDEEALLSGVAENAEAA